LHWDEHAKTPIHGHPKVFFVYLISGELEIFNYSNDTLENPQKTTLQKGDCNTQQGISNEYNNNIHRVNAKKHSLSLHFYSEDPKKGQVFN
jgi:hypothetical protein